MVFPIFISRERVCRNIPGNLLKELKELLRKLQLVCEYAGNVGFTMKVNAEGIECRSTTVEGNEMCRRVGDCIKHENMSGTLEVSDRYSVEYASKQGIKVKVRYDMCRAHISVEGKNVSAFSETLFVVTRISYEIIPCKEIKVSGELCGTNIDTALRTLEEMVDDLKDKIDYRRLLLLYGKLALYP